MMEKIKVGGKYNFSKKGLHYGSKDWNKLSKAYENDPKPIKFTSSDGSSIERKGKSVYIDGKKAYYNKLRGGSEYLDDENGRTLAFWSNYKNNGFAKKFGKPEKYKEKKFKKISNSQRLNNPLQGSDKRKAKGKKKLSRC